MARKFKEGDKVKIVKDMCIGGDHHNVKLGRKGKIIEIDIGDPKYPYFVEFKNGDTMNFSARELEKVEKVEKQKNKK